jgi:hypothetical protein
MEYEYACKTDENPCRQFQFCQNIQDDEPSTTDEQLMYLWDLMFWGEKEADDQPYSTEDSLLRHVNRLIVNPPVPEMIMRRQRRIFLTFHLAGEMKRLLELGSTNGLFKKRPKRNN